MEAMDDSLGDAAENVDWPSRWLDISKVLDRSGPLSVPDFEAGLFNMIRNQCKILVIGAGGLGCELLKNLAMMGFVNIHVIDMDTIDLSNLNRQFLFREKDIGNSKAEVAAEFINNRVPGVKVTPYFARIEDKPVEFYETFSIIVCGLDAIAPRRWINRLICSMCEYNDDGELQPDTVHPLVDGGTEGFKGNARVIAPGLTACVECILDYYPPQDKFPMCTLAQTPRLPEHCVEYVKIVQWPKDNPFGGESTEIDGDNPEHVAWIHERSVERAAQHGILGPTYRLTHGVIKNIIPAVASTNAVIAAICANEVFKIAYCCYPNLKSYVSFNDSYGIFTNTHEAERLPDCMACSIKPRNLTFKEETTLGDVLDFLKESSQYQMMNPGVTTTTESGNKTLYMPGIAALENATKENLEKTLIELGFVNGQQILVNDKTSPTGFTFNIYFK
ncbi:NEDD8-activating enzyme E1 catalytic subunit-like [Varroa jacobsoni]|uniref:NEDD8-activating enzyme E1 catalytic subunit n=1 Tax=Varroa destructor TaxID=109461 RepID=A0A7M7JWF6_VARDE|nr:NEDD8-activating enzyme E1 catalytic subunit-like [Varroa destructor]XP_022691734.1 NEDD8-activating enzyme E1 catalytic subunit-like [Varroa jacobsoni]